MRASSKPRSAPQTREQAEADVESAIAREYELLSKKSAIQKEASIIGELRRAFNFGNVSEAEWRMLEAEIVMAKAMRINAENRLKAFDQQKS